MAAIASYCGLAKATTCASRACALSIAPAHRVFWSRDVYGNSVALVDFLEEAAQLDIVNDVTLERMDPFPEKRFHEPWLVPWPVDYDPMELIVTASYLTPSYPEERAALRQWASALLPHAGNDAEGVMLELCRRVHAAIAYRRRMEKGVQSPMQTVETGSGSCRDMATLLMDAARALGVASRFASGYLHGLASIQGRASTHAWTEVYLPTLGWRGFDPTTGAAIGLRHVVAGVSQHPRGVMPVSGSFVGARNLFQSLDVDVQTRELDDSRGGHAS